MPNPLRKRDSRKRHERLKAEEEEPKSEEVKEMLREIEIEEALQYLWKHNRAKYFEVLEKLEKQKKEEKNNDR